MGKNKGAEGAGTSKSVASRKKQQDEARDAKRNRRKERHEQKNTTPDVNMTITPLHLVCMNKTFEQANAAYFALRESTTLPIYVPRFKYADAAQRAVMSGTLDLELPFELVRRVESELAPHWKRAKLETVQNEES